MNRTNTWAPLGDPRKRAYAAQFIGEAFVTAYNLMLQNKEKVETVANTILEKKEIYGDDLVGLLDAQHFKRPEIDWTDEGCWPKFMNWSKYEPRGRGEAGGHEGPGAQDSAAAPEWRTPHDRIRHPRRTKRQAGPTEGNRLARPSVGKPAGRYQGRFLALYVVLGAVLVAAVVGFVVLMVDPSSSSSSSDSTASGAAWSPWKPTSGTTAAMAREIAKHVANEYKLNKKGTPLVAVVAGPPTVTADTPQSRSRRSWSTPATGTTSSRRTRRGRATLRPGHRLLDRYR